MNFEEFARRLGDGLGIAGICVIALGALVAAGLYLFRVVGRRATPVEAYHCLRRDIGRSILLGLELLVAADIIGTVVVSPTFESVGVLAAIVLIRTFLSMTLEVEIEGRWPWRRAGAADRPEKPSF